MHDWADLEDVKKEIRESVARVIPKDPIVVNMFMQLPSGQLVRLGSLAPGRTVNIGGICWEVLGQGPKTRLKKVTTKAGRPAIVELPAEAMVEE
jgi:hypothetical protein